MSPIGWALRPFKHYVDFSGRSPRAEYWWFVLSVTIGGLILGVIDGAVLGGPIVGNYGPLGLAQVLGTFFPSIAVTVRRLHDSERTGWWAIFKAASYLSVFAMLSAPAVTAANPTDLQIVLIPLLIIGGLGGLLLLFFLIQEGDSGPNAYGPDPYGPGDLEEVFA